MARVFFEDYRDDLRERIEKSLYKQETKDKRWSGIYLTNKELQGLFFLMDSYVRYYLFLRRMFWFNRWFKMSKTHPFNGEPDWR